MALDVRARIEHSGGQSGASGASSRMWNNRASHQAEHVLEDMAGVKSRGRGKMLQATDAALRRLHQRTALWGFDARLTYRSIAEGSRFRRQLREFKEQRRRAPDRSDFPMGPMLPMHHDRLDTAGAARGHYFHQDLLVARKIHARCPRRHIDVGSSIYGFVSHVASFRDIEVLDVRPLNASIEGIAFVQQDVMNLDESWWGVTDSVSCLHALEHFGLGRYGDPIDFGGWRRGLDGLTGLLESGGALYLSVPTGVVQRVEFNAHRVFSVPFIRRELESRFTIDSLDFVTDSGDLITNVNPHGSEAENSFGAAYGCSIWTATKK